MPVRRNDYGPATNSAGKVNDATKEQLRRDGPAAAFHPREPRRNPLPETRPRRER